MSRQFRQFDEIDRSIALKIIAEPGKCIRHYLDPHLADISEPAGRSRIRDLSVRGLVHLEKTKRDVLVWPLDSLKSELFGSG